MIIALHEAHEDSVLDVPHQHVGGGESLVVVGGAVHVEVQLAGAGPWKRVMSDFLVTVCGWKRIPSSNI